jgi:hypothetical protein
MPLLDSFMLRTNWSRPFIGRHVERGEDIQFRHVIDMVSQN